MKIKNIKPEYVVNFKRPTGTEIKYINRHWYLYERKGIYDQVRRKNAKNPDLFWIKLLKKDSYLAS